MYFISLNTCMFVCMYVCMHACIYVCIFVKECIYMYVCMYVPALDALAEGEDASQERCSGVGAH